MSTPTLIFFLAVIACLPAAIRVTGRPSIRVRNATALALIVMWLFSRLVWALTGEWLPLKAMVIQDMVVIATVFAKRDWQDCAPYVDLRRQFAAMWLERSPWDRAILALYAPTWLLYAPVAAPIIQFWALWGIGLAQLALAGHEALSLWLRDNGQSTRADAPGRPPPRTFFAPVGSEVYG